MDQALIHGSPFYELTSLLSLATFVGLVGFVLRQPLIVCFILVGMIVGPAGLDLLQEGANIELLAELGIAVLLFLIGLKLDITMMKTLGPVALVTGLGQIVFTFLTGFGLTYLLEIPKQDAFFIAIALVFSSTVIIVKLLSDNRAIDSLYGRIALGILIVQDLVVVIVMILLSALGAANPDMMVHAKLISLGYFLFDILLLFLSLTLFIRYIANSLVATMAYSSELLVIFAIGWAAFGASLCSLLGFSKELGGLLAGISLASTPFRDMLIAKLTSMRDFLLLFFFVVLGSQINFTLFKDQWLDALILSVFVLVTKPFIINVIMGFMGYRKRTNFMVGVSLAQLSEFSLVLMALAFKLNYLSMEGMALVTLVALITIAISVYMITYASALYTWIEPFLDHFERKIPFSEENIYQRKIEKKNYDVIIFGLGRYGSAIAEHLLRKGYEVLGIDYNPDEVMSWRSQGYDGVYGDACNLDFFHQLRLKEVKWVVSAIPQHAFGLTHEDPRRVLIEALKHRRYKGKIAVSTQFFHEVHEFKKLGAQVVFLPFYDAAEKAVEYLLDEEEE